MYSRLLVRRLGTVAALCATLVTCRDITAPERPASAIPLAPPAVFARWWAMTEACSGVTGPFSNVSWYEVPGVDSFDRDGTDVLGYWTNAGNEIVLAGKAALEGGNVRHEMLHALLRGGGHARDQFLGRCAGVVDCGTNCIADAGPAPMSHPDAAPATAAAFEVTVEVSPAAPSSARDGGFFSVTISARNTAPRPVVARLGSTNVRARSFQFDVRGLAGSMTASRIVLDASSVTFAPGETKRQVFDFSIGNPLAPRWLPPGTYTVLGAYGSHWTAPTSVTVGP
jgi:hypothetical protein